MRTTSGFVSRGGMKSMSRTDPSEVSSVVSRTSVSSCVLHEQCAVRTEPLEGRTVEGRPVSVRGSLVEGRRVRLAHVEQTLGDCVDDELVVAVELFGFLTRGMRPGRVSFLCLSQQRLLIRP